LTDSHASGLLATQSVAISPVSPVYNYDHHQHQQQHQHHHHHQLGGTPTPRHVDFTRSSPSSMMPVVEPAASAVDDARLPSYGAPIPLDGFCSPASTVSAAAVCTPLVALGDDRAPSDAAALQLIDYVTPRGGDCAGPYGHLPARADIYRPMSAAPGDPFAGAGDMYRAFSVPPLKSELV